MIMGEMCDFEAEYYPQAWNTDRVKNGKRRDVVIRLNATEYEAYKSIGGAVGTRKLIVSEHKKNQSAIQLTTPQPTTGAA